jgi:hypothetical protein
MPAIGMKNQGKPGFWIVIDHAKRIKPLINKKRVSSSKPWKWE